MGSYKHFNGFVPLRDFDGGTELGVSRHALTAGVTANKGDLMVAVAGGTVEPLTNLNQYAVVVGVCAGYAKEVADTSFTEEQLDYGYVMVYDDPRIVYGVKVAPVATTTGTALAATDVFAIVNPYIGAAGANQFSGMMLDASTNGNSNAILRVKGLYNDPNNSWGDGCTVEVILATGLWFSAATL